jgi:prefoldin subunit 5
VHPKVQKTIDSLKTKHDKLLADNKALKQQLLALKSQHSRIRRIPKAEPAPQA